MYPAISENVKALVSCVTACAGLGARRHEAVEHVHLRIPYSLTSAGTGLPSTYLSTDVCSPSP